MFDNHALEFHRNALALLPASTDRHPGVAFYVDGKPPQRFCTCQKSGNKTCPHLKALFTAIDKTGITGNGLNLETRFRQSVWHDLATVLSQGDRLTPQTTPNALLQKRPPDTA